jgi:hypothetical protein
MGAATWTVLVSALLIGSIASAQDNMLRLGRNSYAPITRHYSGR